MDVKNVAHIRNNETGEVRQHDAGDDATQYVFLWEEGNYSCDCNRELFWLRASEDDGGIKCSEGRFSVNLERLDTGEVFYREFDGNS